MRRIDVIEGRPFGVDVNLAPQLRLAMNRLQMQLRPSSTFLSEHENRFLIQNLIGTIRLNHHTVLDVTPKVDPNQGWQEAVLDLIVEGDRIDLSGNRLGGQVHRPKGFLDLLALAYADRLALAIQRDGPISVMTRKAETRGYIRGKLNVEQYIRSATYRPHEFPVSFDELSLSNDFARAMAHVARCLATVTESPIVRSKLRELADLLDRLQSYDLGVNYRVASRNMPTQWSAFRPAWSIAIAVLSNMSPLGKVGSYSRLEVAIEPWRLLERLLMRVLDAVQATAIDRRDLVSAPHVKSQLLKAMGGDEWSSSVQPDGVLLRNRRTAATFEAKYSAGHGKGLQREHVFQAISAARSLASPLAVLVYPENFEARWARLHTIGEYPRYLVAIGLDLFSYRRGRGEQVRAKRIMDLLRGPRATSQMPFPLR